MKNNFLRVISIVLCLAVLTGFAAAAAPRAQTVSVTASQDAVESPSLRRFVKYVGSALMWLRFAATLPSAVSGIPFPADFEEFAVAAERAGYNFLNLIAQKLLELLCVLYPDPRGTEYFSEYDSEGFLAGREGYAESNEGGRWSVGFAERSLIPNNFEADKYIMGRKLNVVSFAGGARATELLDDQRVRAAAIDDGSGRGTVVLAVIDGIGLSLTEVKAIRAMLADFAREHNVVDINVSCTHVHSCIDTQGVSSPFLYTLVGNGLNNEFGVGSDIPSLGGESVFMKNLREQTATAIRDAVRDMTEGTLSYYTVDGDRFLKDKKEPMSYENRFAALQFEPDDASGGVYIVDLACHPTSFSFDNTAVSSDYIYYMEEVFNSEGYDMLFLQGALGAITKNTESLDIPQDTGDEHIEMKTFGRAVARYILDAKGTGEPLAPVLNSRHEEFTLECTNYLLMLAIKCKLASNIVYKTGDSGKDFILPTELGYIDFGGRAAFALIPAELYPEVFVGGAHTARTAWDYTDWTCEPMNTMARDGIDMFAVCFANDAIGYVVTDNDFAFIAHQPDELLSAGKHTASTIVAAFSKLMSGVYA